MTFKELVKEKGFTLYAYNEVVENLPKKQEGVLEFFKLDRYVSEYDLEKEYTQRDLIPADPYHLIATSTERLDEMKFVATHWKDAKGNWCCAAFRRWGDEREVNVLRNDYDWLDRWWFAGVRKSDLGNFETKNSSDSLPLELRLKKLEMWATNLGMK